MYVGGVVYILEDKVINLVGLMTNLVPFQPYNTRYFIMSVNSTTHLDKEWKERESNDPFFF